jgi:pimeloyl-ACP methyl ester carboxylesterase
MRTLFITFMCLLTLIVVSCATAPVTEPAQPTQAPSPTAAPRPTQPGEEFDVGGYSLYIDCEGTGSPTVILESGLDGDVVTWRDVHPEVAQFTRVCRYDRAGLAHSDYGPTPRDAGLISADLHTLLAEAGESPPYILVGHSFGGLLIRRYASDYPEEVAGLVFVDSLHEGWWEEALALLPEPRADESPRLASFRAYLTDGWREPSASFEMMDIPAVVEQVRETGGFGDIPITVLTATRFDVLNPGLPPDLETSLAELFHEQQGQLAELSTAGTQIFIPDSGHNIPRENPEAVIDAIREMIANL